MTYKEFIQNIIDTRGQWNCDGIYEIHHIVPQSKGGGPSSWRRNTKHENLIYLTPKEHYEAHKLLYEENKGDNSLMWAFWRMAQNCEGEYISSDEYQYARELFIKEIASKPKTDEWKEKMRRPLSEEHKKKIGLANTGKKRPDLSEFNTRTKKGKKDSYETHLRKCAAQSGKNNNNAKKCLNVELNIIYDTCREAAKSVGGNSGNLSHYMKRNKKYKGYTWKYI